MLMSLLALLGAIAGAFSGEFHNFLGLGRTVLIITLFFICVIVVLFGSRRNLRVLICGLLLLAFSFAWGAWHNWYPSGDVHHARTGRILRAMGEGASARVIVGLSSGSWLSMPGKGQPGDRGKIHCRGDPPARGRCVFHRELALHYQQQHGWVAVAAQFRGWLEQRLRSWPWRWSGWLQAVLLGDRDGLDWRLRRSFSDSGMAHLLVLSGFHFGLAFRLLWQLMLWGWRVVYSLRLLSPGVWFHLRSMTYLLVMLLSGFGLLLVGVSSPGLRAFLLLTITHAIHQFLGLRDKSLRIRLALLVQLVLAPAGLLGLSNIMSWGAYACFVGFEHSAGLGLWRRWQVAIGRQLGLSLLMGLLIGRLSLIGPMANLVLAPWFGLVFYASLLLLIVWEWGSGRAGLQAGIEAYWQAVQWLAECTVVVTAKPWVSPLVAMILTGALLCYGVNQLRCHLRE